MLYIFHSVEQLGGKVVSLDVFFLFRFKCIANNIFLYSTHTTYFIYLNLCNILLLFIICIKRRYMSVLDNVQHFMSRDGLTISSHLHLWCKWKCCLGPLSNFSLKAITIVSLEPTLYAKAYYQHQDFILIFLILESFRNDLYKVL